VVDDAGVVRDGSGAGLGAGVGTSLGAALRCASSRRGVSPTLSNLSYLIFERVHKVKLSVLETCVAFSKPTQTRRMALNVRMDGCRARAS
jgi:hypothetical protein